MLTSRISLLPLGSICALVFLIACQSTPTTPLESTSGPTGNPTQPAKTGTSTCDCSTFPPKQGCDSECGITTGVIESVTADSVTISVPSITTTATGERKPQITERTFAISPAEAKQFQSLKQGSRVALTFHQQNGQNIAKSIRELPAAPPK
jgi:hypothetical protein